MYYWKEEKGYFEYNIKIANLFTFRKNIEIFSTKIWKYKLYSIFY